MFTKVNARQEQFLWLVVDGMPATRAYAEIYGQDKSESTCAVSASQLLKNPKVMARRQELIASRAARQPVTVEFLTREALATVQEARALGQGSAALQGYQLIAKLHGLLVDKVQTDVLIRKPSASPESPDDMAPDEWLNQYANTKQLVIENIQVVEPSSSTDDGSDTT